MSSTGLAKQERRMVERRPGGAHIIDEDHRRGRSTSHPESEFGSPLAAIIAITAGLPPTQR